MCVFAEMGCVCTVGVQGRWKQFIVSAPVALPLLGLARAVHGTVSILLILYGFRDSHRSSMDDSAVRYRSSMENYYQN